MLYRYQDLRDTYLVQWNKMVIRDDVKKSSVSVLNRKVFPNLSRYKTIEKLTGVPAAFIAVVHLRESNADFNTYLGNGERLDRVTRLVPKGRGPFKTWEEGAIDALTLEGLVNRPDWTIMYCLYNLEKFNGFGYRMHGVPSAYVWAGTNIYTKGKYVRDGVWDPNFVDPQIGAAVQLKCIFELVPELDFTKGNITMPRNDKEKEDKDHDRKVKPTVPAPTSNLLKPHNIFESIFSGIVYLFKYLFTKKGP